MKTKICTQCKKEKCMSDAEEIWQAERRAFKAWYDSAATRTGPDQAWKAWRAAIVSDRRRALAELEPGDYQDVRPKDWMRKEIKALK